MESDLAHQAQSSFHLHNEQEVSRLLSKAHSRSSSRKPSLSENAHNSSADSSSKLVSQDGLDFSTAKHNYEMRATTCAAAVAALEENLAIGLDTVDVACALLLGHCCRAINDGAQEDQIPDDASDEGVDELLDPEGLPPGGPPTKAATSNLGALPPMPVVLHDETGSPLAPMVHEYARLEGYRWMHSKAHGRGSIFSIERFGARGECVLCPAFCAVRPPGSTAFIEAEGSEKRWPAQWLRRILGEFCGRVRKTPKVPPEGYLKVVDAAPSIVLVVPAGKVVIKADPSPKYFSRKAARRHPMYVDAVEMGARLSISVVPLAQTPSGDLDKVDADLLERQLGAQLFAIAGERGRLCVRRDGGPPLDSARVAGVSLDGICAYLGAGWADTLGAMPGSWTRLSVSTARSETLESRLGPPPGRGIFQAIRDAPEPDTCSYCGLAPVVGFELIPSEREVRGEGKMNSVCFLCSAFIRGSPAYQNKLDLTQYICRPADQMVGTANESLDAALSLDQHPAADRAAPDAALTLSPWDSALPSKAAVLMVSCLVHLACPPETWEVDEALAVSSLERELCAALQLNARTARIVSAVPEAESGGFCLGVLLLHPATLDPAKVAADVNSSKVKSKYSGPRAPLQFYRQLEEHLHGSTSQDVAPDQQLVASSTQRALTPCSLVFCEEAAGNPSALQAGPSEDTGNAKSLETPSAFKKYLQKSLSSALSVDENCTSADGSDPMAALLWSFGPSPSQLALRLRELAAAHQAERCHRLLTRWGRSYIDGGAQAALAVVGRDAQSFGGQSALDLAIAAGDRAAMDALLAHVPQCKKSSEDRTAAGAVGPGEDPLAFPLTSPEGESQKKDTAADSTKAAPEQSEEPNHLSLAAQEAMASLLNAPSPLTGHTALYAVALYPSDHTVGFVERLVRRRADPNVIGCLANKGGGYGETALVAAARRGETSLIHKLIQPRGDVNARAADGSCILHVSVERGDRRALEALLRAPGCNVDVADHKGRTALVTALKCVSVELAKILIHAACNVDARDVNGAAPILHTANVHSESLCNLMLERRADPDAADPADYSHIIHLSVQARNAALFSALLAARADIHAPHPRDGRTPLHLAASVRMAPLARMLISLEAQVDARSAVGDTPLRLAVQGLDLESAELLCRARADPNAANKSGCAAVHAAVSSGNTRMAELLVQFGADVHLADSRRWRPIHYSASGGNGEVVELLLDRRANLWARSYYGRTPHDLGQDGAIEALSIASMKCPPPPEYAFNTGSIDVPRLATTVIPKKPSIPRPASVRSQRKVSASSGGRSVGAAGSSSASAYDESSLSNRSAPLQVDATTSVDGGSLPAQDSVQTSGTEVGPSTHLLPKIVRVSASKLRAGGTPRGTKTKDGLMEIRLIGTGVHR